MSYITIDEITDTFVNRGPSSDLYSYLAEADNEMLQLAKQRGVFTASDIATTSGLVDDITIRRYLAYYVSFRYCEDHYGAAGAGNIAASNSDLYRDKMEWYKRRLDETRKQITYEMITGNVDESGDFAINSGFLLRT